MFALKHVTPDFDMSQFERAFSINFNISECSNLPSFNQSQQAPDNVSSCINKLLDSEDEVDAREDKQKQALRIANKLKLQQKTKKNHQNGDSEVNFGEKIHNFYGGSLETEFIQENAYTSLKLSKKTILEQESEQLAILVYHDTLNNQFVDVVREMLCLSDYYYKSPLMYTYRTSESQAYPEFELLLMRSFDQLSPQMAHLIIPHEVGSEDYLKLMRNLVSNESGGAILVLRAVCIKQRLKDRLEYIEQSHYSNQTAGIYEDVETFWPFFTICSNKIIRKILPSLGKLYEDSSTRPLSKFLAPLRGSHGHESFKNENFSFVLIRPHAVKQGLPKILARLSQCGFEVVAIKKTQIQSDMVDELGACKVPERGAQNFTPMIREMWARDLLENECVVMVVKRVNAVYQLHVLAGLEAPNDDSNSYGGNGAGGI